MWKVNHKRYKYIKSAFTNYLFNNKDDVTNSMNRWIEVFGSDAKEAPFPYNLLKI